MANSLEEMTAFFDKVEKLPQDNAKNFSLLKRDAFPNRYFHITTKNEHEYLGKKGRYKLWDYTILQILKTFPDLDYKGVNRWYSSRVTIKNNQTELKIWSPLGDGLWSYLLGNRIKGTLKENIVGRS